MSVKKEDFLKILQSSTREDLNDIIKQKGKPPKRFKPITHCK